MAVEIESEILLLAGETPNSWGSAAFNIGRGGNSGGLHVGIARRGDVNDGSTAHGGSLVVYNSG